MNARQRRAQRYREKCKRLDRRLTEALTGCSWRVAKALNAPPLQRSSTSDEH